MFALLVLTGGAFADDPAAAAEAPRIRSGPVTAPERAFWSFQPVEDSPVPPVGDASWPAGAIDRFILSRLEREGLAPSRPADRRTLIRRVSYDLIGLPPSVGEVEAFLADPAEDDAAFARVVDRLLASPDLGERWGRHWLDVVHYADTAGETADYPVPQARLYRDYVIESFRSDRPYDEFVREQIAGDLLALDGPRERYVEQVIATGFIATSRRFGFDPENYHHLTIQDTIDNLGQAFLGLSLGCARCHDHKFDPVSLGDYYALYGIFQSTRYAFPGSEEKKRPRDLVPLLPPGEAEPLRRAFEGELASLEGEIKKLVEEKGAIEKEVQRCQAQSDAAAQDRLVSLRSRAGLVEEQRRGKEGRRDQLAAAGPYPVAYGAVEGTPAEARIQIRGEPLQPGPEVRRRFLEVLGGDPLPPDAAGSGRRELARWLSRAENPLTARVMVNRIWQHHFGVGLVSTESDFGVRGQRPTHPELLDWLARRFVESRWSVKAMHRLILLSSAYRQSAQGREEAAAKDPENRLLARFSRRRLDAEALRDSLLLLAGDLDRTAGGEHPFPPVRDWGFTQHNPFAAVYETNRRSVYLMTPRLKRHPFLALFDGPDPNTSTARRSPTTVPTQALFFLNDPFVHRCAACLAKRILRDGPDRRGRIDLAHRLALGRPPDEKEAARGAEFLERYEEKLAESNTPPAERERESWAAYCRTIFSGNEFSYVE